MLDPRQAMMELLRKDSRYKLDAYEFVFDALGYAQSVLGLGAENVSEPVQGEPAEEAEDDPEGPRRHVSGQELCEAIRQYAIQQFGYMAKTVLNSWGVHGTGDFGEIVFNLIGIGRMRKTPDDRREDFQDVYDFNAAFKQEFKITPPE